MNRAFAVFDMDGTLVDSMPAWRGIGREYLLSKGIEPPGDLQKKLLAMTMEEAGAYFRTLGIADSPQQISDAINALMHEKYRTTIEPVAGVPAYLEALSKRGVACCVATATDAALAETCLQRLGLRHYFAFILSCEQLGVGKTSPLIYEQAAKRLGAAFPADAAVFEDAPYAAKTAHDAGFYTVGILDPGAAHRHDELRSIVDEWIADYSLAAAQLGRASSKKEG